VRSKDRFAALLADLVVVRVAVLLGNFSPTKAASFSHGEFPTFFSHS
jgi:hypothetical protein